MKNYSHLATFCIGNHLIKFVGQINHFNQVSTINYFLNNPYESNLQIGFQITNRDGYGSRILLDPPFIQGLGLFFETHRIRVGSGFRKYLTGPGSGPGLKVQTLDPSLRLRLEPYTIKYFFLLFSDNPVFEFHGLEQVFVIR